MGQTAKRKGKFESGKLKSSTNQNDRPSILNAVVEANGEQLWRHNTGLKIVELLIIVN